MSPDELLSTLDTARALLWKVDHDGATAEGLDSARDAVAALIAERDAQSKRNAELERLCDATYVAQGADAYHHACETMAAWQKARAKARKDAGCEGSLCDGLSWLQSRVESLEAERDALRNALEHIAGSCEGRSAEVARCALEEGRRPA